MGKLLIITVVLIVLGCLPEAEGKAKDDARRACENIARSAAASPTEVALESKARFIKKGNIPEVEEQVGLNFEADQDIWMVLVDATLENEVFQKRVVCILDDNIVLKKVFSDG